MKDDTTEAEMSYFKSCFWYERINLVGSYYIGNDALAMLGIEAKEFRDLNE